MNKVTHQQTVPTSLLEQDFPIEQVSEASAKEKSIRQGHISTLQQWWARRPLATCRSSVFLALCADAGEVEQSGELVEWLSRLCPEEQTLSAKIVAFAGKLADWSTTDNADFIALAQRMIMLNKKNPPKMVDTFAGGGSFPIEGLRLGVETFAADLSPVATVPLKVAIEYLPNVSSDFYPFFQKITHALAFKITEITSKLYSNDGEDVRAFFWARTYHCPNCQIEVPLLRNFWLEQGTRNQAATISTEGNNNRSTFHLYEPRTKAEKDRASRGTVTQKGSICPNCEHKVSTSWLRSVAVAGQMGDRLYAKLVVTEDGKRLYKEISSQDEHLAISVKLSEDPRRKVYTVPNQEFDANGIRHTWAMQYGIKTTADLYSFRQSVALLEVINLLEEEKQSILAEFGNSANSKCAILLLSLLFNRLVTYGTKHAWWQPNGGFPASMFTKQAIPMVWNYVEIPVCSVGAAGWSSAVSWIEKVVEHLLKLPHGGIVWQGDAVTTPLEDNSIDLVTIDPPYYDSIVYAYLADVYYVWMKEYLSDLLPEYFDKAVSPKEEEAIVDRPHTLAPQPKTRKHFHNKLRDAFSEVARILKPDGQFVLMFGHKKVEAWEAFLTAVLEAGFQPTASYPVHTERKSKFRHGHIDSLSSSCIIVCRKQHTSHRKKITWEEFESELGDLLRIKMLRFRLAHVVGSDLMGALIAPAVGLFSQYASIERGNKALTLRQLLEWLPERVLIYEQQLLALETEATKLHGVQNTLSSLIEQLDKGVWTNGRTWADVLNDSTKFKMLAQYAQLLSSGETETADFLWKNLSENEQILGRLCLQLIASTSELHSVNRQIANASLSRISYNSWSSSTT